MADCAVCGVSVPPSNMRLHLLMAHDQSLPPSTELTEQSEEQFDLEALLVMEERDRAIAEALNAELNGDARDAAEVRGPDAAYIDRLIPEELPNLDDDRALAEALQASLQTQDASCRGAGAAAADAVSSECPVCLSELDDPRDITRTRCCHAFHSSCLRRSLQHQDSCPVCRLSSPMVEPSVEPSVEAPRDPSTQRSNPPRQNPPRNQRPRRPRPTADPASDPTAEARQAMPLESAMIGAMAGAAIGGLLGGMSRNPRDAAAGAMGGASFGAIMGNLAHTIDHELQQPVPVQAYRGRR